MAAEIPWTMHRYGRNYLYGMAEPFESEFWGESEWKMVSWNSAGLTLAEVSEIAARAAIEYQRKEVKPSEGIA